MSWAKLDDRFHENRKIRSLWQSQPAALGLHVMAITYCAGHETDGFVDTLFVLEKVPSASTRKKLVAALVDKGLWIEGDGGWDIHDYLDYNPSTEQLATGRGIDRFRKDLSRDSKLLEAIRDRDCGACRYCAVVVNWKDRKSSVGGTYDHVVPVTQDGQNTFDNVVVCCRGCNNKKGPRTPEQAGMLLLDLPGSTPESSRAAKPISPQNLAPVPTRPLSPQPPEGGDPATAEFDTWLQHHGQVTGMRPPGARTQVLVEIRTSYRARRDEGWTADDLRLAVLGAWHDDHRREHGYVDPISVLRPTKILALVERGRKHAASRNSDVGVDQANAILDRQKAERLANQTGGSAA